MFQRTLLCAAAFLFPGLAMAQAQAVPSPNAQACLSCHRAGTAQPEFPDLSHLDAMMIAESMAQFRDGARTGTIMNRIAKGYSDEENRAIAQELVAASRAGAKP